jgi:hypothetical protein
MNQPCVVYAWSIYQLQWYKGYSFDGALGCQVFRLDVSLQHRR